MATHNGLFVLSADISGGKPRVDCVIDQLHRSRVLDQRIKHKIVRKRGHKRALFGIGTEESESRRCENISREL